MKWAICEQFRDYLYYAPRFVVFTDNNPLTYVLSTAKLNATANRTTVGRGAGGVQFYHPLSARKSKRRR
jgi:hypothetical protein